MSLRRVSRVFVFSPGRSITDYDIKQLLRILVKALERFTDMTLIEAIIMCLTRVQPQLRSVCYSVAHESNVTSLRLMLISGNGSTLYIFIA